MKKLPNNAGNIIIFIIVKPFKTGIVSSIETTHVYLQSHVLLVPSHEITACFTVLKNTDTNNYIENIIIS